jgi:FMN phosphatase YigB (HAD superfamily)
VTVTLLLDLDDTLLDTQISSFLRAFLDAWRDAVLDTMPPDRFIRAMLKSTDRMMLNNRPDCTLREVFLESFLPAIGMDEEQFLSIEDDFYKNVFPRLQALTKPKPQAIQFVDKALEQGAQIVIATNPVFPKTAIDQRLAWVGLPADRFPFQYVPSSEYFHFAKPNPAFFAELLYEIGWPDNPVVMVGDDYKLDILPALQFGLPAYWINSGKAPAENPANVPISSGEIEAVFSWIESEVVKQWRNPFNTPASLLAALIAAPAMIDRLCRDLPESAWHHRAKPGEWSPVEIISHLRDVDREINLPRVEKIISETNPFIAGIDSDPWAEQRGYNQENGSRALRDYLLSRFDLVNALEFKPDDTWRRPARHTIFGPTQLTELMGITVGHDRLHVQQVIEAINAAI